MLAFFYAQHCFDPQTISISMANKNPGTIQVSHAISTSGHPKPPRLSLILPLSQFQLTNLGSHNDTCCVSPELLSIWWAQNLMWTDIIIIIISMIIIIIITLIIILIIVFIVIIISTFFLFLFL